MVLGLVSYSRSKILIFFVLLSVMVNSSMSLAISTLVFDESVTLEQQPPKKPTCHSEYNLEQSTNEVQCESEGILCFQCTAYFAPSLEIKVSPNHQMLNTHLVNKIPVIFPSSFYRPPRTIIS